MRKLKAPSLSFFSFLLFGLSLVGIFQNCSGDLKSDAQSNPTQCKGNPSTAPATCQSGTYQIDANGLIGTLVISSVSTSGNFSATITNSQNSASFNGVCRNGTIGFDDGIPYAGSYTSNNNMSGLFTYAGVPYRWSAVKITKAADQCQQGEVSACSDVTGSGNRTCGTQSMYGSCVMNSCANGYVLSHGPCVSQKKIAHIVLVIGQSNAMNFGTLDQGCPGGWSRDERIQIWNGSNFNTYSPGINSNGDTTNATWGPEAEYSRLRLISYPDETSTSSNTPLVALDWRKIKWAKTGLPTQAESLQVIWTGLRFLMPLKSFRKCSLH